MSLILRWLLLGMLVIGGIGCTSSRSTMLLRDESNSFWTKQKAHGVPITLKVPTHVKLYVYEKHFLEAIDVGGVPKIEYLELPVVLRDFAQDYIYTEKIIMVDWKRPAAGSFNLEVDFTEDQYIQKIQHDVTDETIERVSGLLQNLAPQGLFSQAANEPGANVETQIKEIKSVVAVGVFEVDAPDFEQQVAAFINCHINRSHDAWMTPPGVEEFRRKTLDPGFSQPGPILCPMGDCYGDGSGEVTYSNYMNLAPVQQ